MFDYIIVGGGPAGCVLANRLSEDPDTKVLLLEAGKRDLNPLIHMPAGFAYLTGPKFTWGYKTTPQKHLGGREMLFAQGRVLGGGSSINAQVYTRGNPLDYDAWEDAAGCKGWSFKDVLPYFKRSEDNVKFSNDYHGVGGAIKISDPVPQDMTSVFVRATQEAGFEYNPDFNGEKQAGFGYYQCTNRDGRRSSGPAAYLSAIRERDNLTVLTSTITSRVLFDKKRAVGVEYYDKNKQLQTAHVNKEVLITSGAVGSPKLLMLSGVGPADELKSKGIEVVHDLPGVGENLQDHLDAFVVSECSGSYSIDKYKPWYMSLWAGTQYTFFKTGLVASNLCDGGGFGWADKSAASPDIQFHFLPGSGLEAGLSNIKNGVTLNSAFLRPLSRGTIKLATSNPMDAPLIDPNYWADEYDQKMSIEGFKIARDIMAQPSFKPFIKRESFPSVDVQTDDEIKQYIMQHAKTDYHPVGTCKMGPDSDASAVVSPDLRVHGLEGIRVADSSIMPLLVSSNTYAPTVMIAERASDFILVGSD